MDPGESLSNHVVHSFDTDVYGSIRPDTSFSIETRKKLGIHGLIPPNVESHALQAQRCEFAVSGRTELY